VTGRPVVDEIPVTLAVLVSYLALAAATGVFDPTTSKLIQYGALVGAMAADGEGWRLISYAFLHGGLMHLAMNTVALTALGPGLERALGPLRFSILYVISAVGGGVAAVVWGGAELVLVGGSGALFGMLGATLAVHIRSGRHGMDYLSSQAGRRTMLLVVAYLALGLVIPRISNSAHVGGLLAGFVLTQCFLLPPRHERDGLARAALLGWIALYIGCIAWCMFPATRWDRLYARMAQSEENDPQVLQALLRVRQRENGLSARSLAIDDGELRSILERIYGTRWEAWTQVEDPKSRGDTDPR